MDWKTGNIVRLKSGGPAMTVRFVESKGVYCEWFDSGSGKIVGHKFYAEQLKEANPDPFPAPPATSTSMQTIK